MADKLTDRTALGTHPAENDLHYVVDVSDTTDDATGTSKKVTTANKHLVTNGWQKRVTGYQGYIVLAASGNLDGDLVQTGDVIMGKGAFAGGNMIMAVAKQNTPTLDAHLDFYLNNAVLP